MHLVGVTPPFGPPPALSRPARASRVSYRPEVAVLDIGMPQQNGYEVARELRARPWARDLVLIAVTEWGQENDRTRAFEAGFDDHLVKPVEATAILEMLARHAHKVASE